MRTPTATAAPRSTKSTLRHEALARRATIDPVATGIEIAAQILRHVPLAPGSAIAGVWPLPGEFDLRDLWRTLHERRHPILLPETPPRGEALIFRRWHPASELLPGRFGTRHPAGDPGTPDLIFVPMLAFDRRGHRLGYGAGYYDRTLASLPGIPCVGYAHSSQLVAAIPTEPHDLPLPRILTESGPAALYSETGL